MRCYGSVGERGAPAFKRSAISLNFWPLGLMQKQFHFAAAEPSNGKIKKASAVIL